MNCVRIPGSPEHPPIGGGIPDENRIADETRISDATRISDTTCISDATRQSATARTASAYPVTVPLHMPEAGPPCRCQCRRRCQYSVGRNPRHRPQLICQS